MSALRQLIIRLEKRRREAEYVKNTPDACANKKRMADKHISLLDSQLEMLSRADGKGRKSA